MDSLYAKKTTQKERKERIYICRGEGVTCRERVPEAQQIWNMLIACMKKWWLENEKRGFGGLF
jgi:hypothetical protein